DEVVFTALYAGLRRFAAAVAPLEVEPDDLVQDALVRALAVGPLSDLDNAGGYLRTIVIRLAANHRRSLGRQRRALRLLDGAGGAVIDAYPSDLADLDGLDARDRAIVYLSVVEHMKADEIAALLGWSAGRVRMRKTRIMRRLRVDLEDGDA